MMRQIRQFQNPEQFAIDNWIIKERPVIISISSSSVMSECNIINTLYVLYEPAPFQENIKSSHKNKLSL